MSVIYWILLAAAFEFMPATGRAGAMLAGAAVPDWHNSFALNPALSMSCEKLVAGVAYSRPYGLAGLDWAQASVGTGLGRARGGLALTSLALGQYRESDVALVLGAEPLKSLAVGLGVHALVVSCRDRTDAAASFDLGVHWRSGWLGLGAAGFAVNGPRFANGDGVPLRLVVAGSARPVEPLLLAFDVERAGGEERATLGAEFNIVPPMDLRFGLGYEPLSYAVGVGINVGPASVDYAYRFHPLLKDTHLLGLRATWR